jgi:hypothetical protein
LRTRRSRAGRLRPRAVAALAVALLACALALLGGSGPTVQRAVGQASPPQVTPQADASVPAHGVIMLGSSSQGEAWGVGQLGSLNNPTTAIVRYEKGAGWSLFQKLSRFVPDESPLTGQVTPAGVGALLGTVTEVKEEVESTHQVLLVHDAGGSSFQEVPKVPEEGEGALLKSGESLFGKARAPLLAPLDEGGGHAGALVVPVNSNASGVAEEAVLHWNGNKWTREQIEIPGAKEGFRVLAIEAGSPTNAWLLGQLPAGGVALFRRSLGGEASWKPVSPVPSGTPGEALSVDGEPFTVAGIGGPPTAKAQILTVTEEGVWLDGERPDAHALVTMFFKPAAADSGQVTGSWCNIPAGAKAGTPPCAYTLPTSLPTGASRSIAWPGSPFGQRVITGLPDGASLRLEGTVFTRVLGLGAEGDSNPGAIDGAAFSEPREGWLGSELLPTHLTAERQPSRLAPYPVPFRYALLAVAPQPGATVGALSSQALAVGDHGEVARYTPGEGWQPESLLGAAGRPVTPTLRAVAWPTPGRAYAVGELGQMWRWRAETGFWEADPAAPRNFRGNLLGIAFNPDEPGVGYAVGQQGVLLRYGKSWAQEALPAEVQGASFTSIAFAGSEAIVAYRIAHPQSASNPAAFYTGGLLVHNGAGWHVDQGAAAALAPHGLPWAVAGLPDGGAAFSGEDSEEVPVVFERNGAGEGWQSTGAPYPGTSAPGSLALFREGGALRVVGSGAIPRTRETDFVIPAPGGFPETLIKPYPVASGYVLRQTATGWSDEENDRNDAGPPAGGYKKWDIPYRPDPTAAVLVDPSGSVGWAVGGVIEPNDEEEGRLDTADIARYREAGVAPPGVGSAPVPGSGQALFAIGGDAQCAAPCADRAEDRLGPDLWLSSAHEQAGHIQGVRAFFHLGPRLTAGETVHEKLSQEIPYEEEFARYQTLLSGAPTSFPVVSSTDIAGATGECLFEQGFAAFPKPLGEGGEAPGLAPAGGSTEPCSEHRAYYAIRSSGAGGTVRLIVLDEASSVGPEQLRWLASELSEAAGKEAAIVLGSANLNEKVAASDPAAIAVASTLVEGHASAYFYDSPEQNVQQTLRAGSGSIPTFGTGTLGYGEASKAARRDFIGQSGFLLAEIGAYEPASEQAPVKVRLIPNIGELAMEAQDGVLLHRSQVAQFAALARRPRSGCRAEATSTRCENSPYIPIPVNCIGANCASAIFPEYTFTSSNPELGNFVKPNLASAEQNAVLLEHEEPVADPQSGLFCAYNAGAVTVTITAGGLSASLPVTIQAGSVRRPCGTQPLKNVAAQQQAVAPVPPAPAPAPAGPAPASSSPPPVLLLPPPPLVPLPPARPAPPARPSPPPFVILPALASPVLAFTPPPVPTPARPTPPTGTSAVTSPVEVAEHEEEQEEATESVSNQALAYSAPEYEPSPAYALGVVLLAAFAGASIGRRRRGRGEVRIAPATLSTIRSQRRLSRPHEDVNRW